MVGLASSTTPSTRASTFSSSDQLDLADRAADSAGDLFGGESIVGKLVDLVAIPPADVAGSGNLPVLQIQTGVVEVRGMRRRRLQMVCRRRSSV